MHNGDLFYFNTLIQQFWIFLATAILIKFLTCPFHFFLQNQTARCQKLLVILKGLFKITIAVLNRFCTLTEPLPHTPALVLRLNRKYQDGCGTRVGTRVKCRPKLDEIYTPVLHFISSFEVPTSY